MPCYSSGVAEPFYLGVCKCAPAEGPTIGGCVHRLRPTVLVPWLSIEAWVGVHYVLPFTPLSPLSKSIHEYPPGYRPSKWLKMTGLYSRFIG